MSGVGRTLGPMSDTVAAEDTAEVSAEQLTRASLSRQVLLERVPLAVEEAVRRMVAVQAQQPESVYVGLASRLSDFDPAAVDRAFQQRTLVKATLVRITLHAAHRDDHATLRVAALPTLRGAAFDKRYFETGRDPAETDALVPALLEFASSPRTSTELQKWLAEQLDGEGHSRVWRALRAIAPLVHEPTGGGWSFGQRPAYRAAADTAGPVRATAEQCAAALREVVPRYLAAFGPASVADIAQFALVQRSRVKDAVRALGDRLVTLRGPDGVVLYDVPGGRIPAPDEPAPPRLLPMWDNLLLAYADRSRVIPPEFRQVVTRVNGDVLPTLLVDGKVAGVWRVLDGTVEATAFRPLTRSAWRGLAAEAERLMQLLGDREPAMFQRYHHWWRRLPDGEVRILAG